jgi:hypothetical protein
LIAEAGAKRRESWALFKGLPWPVWAWLGAFAVVLLAMVVRLMMPWQPPRTFPLLGYFDRIPSPTPKPHR